MGQSLVHQHRHLLPVDPRPSLLATFQCPFQQPQIVRPYCALDSSCPFGHQNEPNLHRDLRPIPERFCLEFLLNKCTSGKLNSDQLVQCEHGFHPSRQDLLDPEQFVPLMTEAILGKPIEYKNWQVRGPARCVICLCPIPTLSSPTNGCVLYGVLENCSHQFCSKCIIDWRTNQQTLNSRGERNIGTAFRCPTCRAPSSRIMLWPVLIQYFGVFNAWYLIQKHLFKIYLAENIAVCVKQVNEDRLFQLSFNNYLEVLPFSAFLPLDVNAQADLPTRPIEPKSNQSEAPEATRSASNGTSVQTQVSLDRNVLIKFQCLFQQQDKPPYCSHHLTCPFGHHDLERDTTPLRPLLQCYCLDFLLSKCASTKLEPLNPGQMVKCEFGFHPSPQDLLEPENFARRVASAVQGYNANARNELFKQQDCARCSKSIPTSWYSRDDLTYDNLVGLLDSCGHCYCWHCLRDLVEIIPPLYDILCPVCVTISRRILLWPALVHSSTLKAHLFKVQMDCFGLHVDPDTKIVLRQVDEVGIFIASIIFKSSGRFFGIRIRTLFV